MSVHQLIALKSQGMTPDYAGWLKQQFLQATVEELPYTMSFVLVNEMIRTLK
jgi:hypothetical protein